MYKYIYIYFANKDACPQSQFMREPCGHNTNKQKIMKICICFTGIYSLANGA